MTDCNFQDARWRYLFQNHSLEEVKSWNKRLVIFRYFRANGGQANDSDSLDAALRYDGDADLLAVLAQLGVTLKVRDSTPEDSDGFAKLVPGTRWIEQPGHAEIGGIHVFIWCAAEHIRISPHVEKWKVTEASILAAEALEPFLSPARERIIAPPRDRKNYLCIKSYPFLGT